VLPFAVALMERAQVADHDLILLAGGELPGERLLERFRAWQLAKRSMVDVLVVRGSGLELFCVRHTDSRVGPFAWRMRRLAFKAGESSEIAPVLSGLDGAVVRRVGGRAPAA